MTSSGNGDSLEIGMIIAWTLVTDPSDSYLECNGQSVDNSKYPKLYALMHNTPDYRGVFLRGLGGNSAALGVLQEDAIRNIKGSFVVIGNALSYSGAFNQTQYWWTGSEWGNYSPTIYYQTEFDASRVVPVADENRPINKAVRYFIKAK